MLSPAPTWPNNRPSNLPPWLLSLAVLTLLVLSSPTAEAEVVCDPFRWEKERLDYTAANDQRRVRQVESHHFDAGTENLIKGKTGAVGPDIDFLVRYSPNHHRGLAALVALSLKTKSPKPSGVSIPVECFLLRAIEFKPDDAEVHKIYGAYLARLGRPAEALTRFEEAEKLAPDDPVVAYNLGLLLADKGQFERARQYAKKAYDAGLPYSGLRDKLAREGQWR